MAFQPGVSDLGFEEDRARPSRFPRVAIARVEHVVEHQSEILLRPIVAERDSRGIWLVGEVCVEFATAEVGAVKALAPRRAMDEEVVIFTEVVAWWVRSTCQADLGRDEIP